MLGSTALMPAMQALKHPTTLPLLSFLRGAPYDM